MAQDRIVVLSLGQGRYGAEARAERDFRRATMAALSGTASECGWAVLGADLCGSGRRSSGILDRGRGRKYYILTHRVPEAVLTSFAFWGIFLLLIPVFYERRITPNTAYLASGDFWALTLSAAEPKEVIDLGN